MSDLTAEELRSKYGTPEQVPAGPVLRLLLGADAAHAPCTAIAHRYPSVEAFEAFADGNRRHHGHDTLGPIVMDGGIFGVVLLKPPQP